MLVWAVMLGCPADEPSGGGPSDPPTSPAPVCGDGVVDAGEACDDGAANADTAACKRDCTPAVCGDSVVAAGIEGCDDGTANAADAPCTPDCGVATCGDGYVLPGVEACDDGQENGDVAACTSACALAACGDGWVWDGVEGCDDANAEGCDGCSPDCQPPTVVSLGQADVVLRGDVASRALGYSVLGGADVSGDGVGDLVVGAFAFELGQRATVYVFDGPIAAGDALADADAVLTTAGAPYTLGVAAGDLNGDGVGDLVVGSGGYGPDGVVDVVYGPITGDITLDAADLRIAGDEFDTQIGPIVEVADLTGDGQDDLLIGTLGYGPDSGKVHVFFGPLGAGVSSVTSADATLVGTEQYDRFGSAVAAPGDLDGDGAPDLVVGASFVGDYVGAVYVVSGPLVPGRQTVASALTLSGTLPSESAGTALGGGDLNDDGAVDLIVGTSDDRVWVLFGPLAASAPLTDADVVLTGATPIGYAGTALDVGDVNGDGTDDLLVGGFAYDGPDPQSGAVYVVEGPIAAGAHDLADADVTWVGEALDDYAGRVVSAGDVDGDGTADVIASSVDHDGPASNAGAAYVVFGP